MLVFAAVSILLGMGIVKSPFVKCEKCKDTTTVIDDIKKTDTKTADDTKTTTNTVSDSDISKKTEIAADDCFQYSAKIVNGNIEVTGYNKTITIKVGNAKYLERVGFMACGTNYLLFVTEDGQVYSINELETTLRTKDNTEYKPSELGDLFRKLTNSNDNIVAFVSDESLYEKSVIDDYGKTSKNIGVVDANGKLVVLTWGYFSLG